MTTYRVTATMTLEAESPALATERLSDLLDLPNCSQPVEVVAREYGLASQGENHPAIITMHALAEAVQALRVDPELVTDLDLGAASDLVERAMHAFSEFYLLFAHQERTIEEQRVRIIRADQAWLRVTDANSALNVALNAANTRIADASRALEQLLISASIDTQRSSVFFTDVQKARVALDPSAAAPHSVERTTAPRLAAGSR